MRLAAQNHSHVTHPVPEYGEIINSATPPSSTQSRGLLSCGFESHCFYFFCDVSCIIFSIHGE